MYLDILCSVWVTLLFGKIRQISQGISITNFMAAGQAGCKQFQCGLFKWFSKSARFCWIVTESGRIWWPHNPNHGYEWPKKTVTQWTVVVAGADQLRNSGRNSVLNIFQYLSTLVYGLIGLSFLERPYLVLDLNFISIMHVNQWFTPWKLAFYRYDLQV